MIGATGVHPVTSRTRQLSPSAPMVLGGRPPGRVGHCQGAFLLTFLMHFSSSCESCIILIADSVDGHVRPDFTKEECEAFLLIVDHFVISSFLIIISGRVCISADFYFSALPCGEEVIWFGICKFTKW